MYQTTTAYPTRLDKEEEEEEDKCMEQEQEVPNWMKSKADAKIYIERMRGLLEVIASFGGGSLSEHGHGQQVKAGYSADEQTKGIQAAIAQAMEYWKLEE